MKSFARFGNGSIVYFEKKIQCPLKRFKWSELMPAQREHHNELRSTWRKCSKTLKDWIKLNFVSCLVQFNHWKSFFCCCVWFDFVLHSLRLRANRKFSDVVVFFSFLLFKIIFPTSVAHPILFFRWILLLTQRALFFVRFYLFTLCLKLRRTNISQCRHFSCCEMPCQLRFINFAIYLRAILHSSTVS